MAWSATVSLASACRLCACASCAEKLRVGLVDGEGNAYQLPGKDLAELSIYLQTKLMWDVQLNANELIDKFLDSYCDNTH